jgi:hypothetical protein
VNLICIQFIADNRVDEKWHPGVIENRLWPTLGQEGPSYHRVSTSKPEEVRGFHGIRTPCMGWTMKPTGMDTSKSQNVHDPDLKWTGPGPGMDMTWTRIGHDADPKRASSGPGMRITRTWNEDHPDPQ